MDHDKPAELSRRATLRALGLFTGSTLLACSGSKQAVRKGDAGPLDASLPEADADAMAARDAASGLPPAEAGACRSTQRDALGPFFEAGAPQRTRIADLTEPGERIQLLGTVFGPDCMTPIAGALLDVWQADAQGRYFDAVDTQYRLRGQVLSDKNGQWTLETIMPGHYENGPGAWRPSHIHFTVSAPGFKSVTTQLYFAGDPYLAPNDGCPTACDSSDPDRIVTLTPGEGARIGDWKVVLERIS